MPDDSSDNNYSDDMVQETCSCNAQVTISGRATLMINTFTFMEKWRRTHRHDMPAPPASETVRAIGFPIPVDDNDED